MRKPFHNKPMHVFWFCMHVTSNYVCQQNSTPYRHCSFVARTFYNYCIGKSPFNSFWLEKSRSSASAKGRGTWFGSKTAWTGANQPLHAVCKKIFQIYKWSKSGGIWPCRLSFSLSNSLLDFYYKIKRNAMSPREENKCFCLCRGKVIWKTRERLGCELRSPWDCRASLKGSDVM